MNGSLLNSSPERTHHGYTQDMSGRAFQASQHLPPVILLELNLSVQQHTVMEEAEVLSVLYLLYNTVVCGAWALGGLVVKTVLKYKHKYWDLSFSLSSPSLQLKKNNSSRVKRSDKDVLYDSSVI